MDSFILSCFINVFVWIHFHLSVVAFEIHGRLNFWQEVSRFVKMMMKMSRTFSNLHLVGIDSFIGHLLMRRILNGGAHQITMGGLGIGDIGLKKSMNLIMNMRVQNQIRHQIDWPLD